MQRLAFPALLSGLLFSTTASAGPLSLQPELQPPARPGIGTIFAAPLPVDPAPAPARHAAVEGPNLGGGFLELLFRGPGGQQAQPPRYEPAPAYAPQPDQRSPLFRPFQMEPDDHGSQLAYPARPEVSPRFLRQEVGYDGKERPGTVIINTRERLLYLVQDGGRAVRYGIGVGRPGFTWAGVHHVSQKREWPDWRPPDEMLKRRPDLPRYMPGGPDNPLGARAMYLGSTLYRIHGSNEPWTIGQAVSSGCIRMRNEDVIDLYSKVRVGTKVVVI